MLSVHIGINPKNYSEKYSHHSNSHACLFVLKHTPVPTSHHTKTIYAKKNILLLVIILSAIIESSSSVKADEQVGSTNIHGGGFWHFTLPHSFEDYYRQTHIDI